MTRREDQPNPKYQKSKPQTVPIETDPTAYARQRLMKDVSKLSGLPSGIGKLDGHLPKAVRGFKADEAIKPEPLSLDSKPPASSNVTTSPRAVIAAGRSKNGKSFALEFIIDRLVEAKKEVMICDCDRDNASLTARFGEDSTYRPELATYHYFELFFKKMKTKQDELRVDAFFDMGFGGMREFGTFAAKNFYKEVLEESGIRPTLMLFLSNNVDDLMPIASLTDSFLPEDVILVQNEGILGAEDDFEIEYRPILADPRIELLLERGAHLLHMPRMPGGQAFHNSKEPFSRAPCSDWQNPLDAFERRGAAVFNRTFAEACDKLKAILPCP